MNVGAGLVIITQKIGEDYFSRLDIKGDDYRSQLATTGHYPVAPLYTLCTSRNIIHPVHNYKQDNYTPFAQARPLHTLFTLQARQLYNLYTSNTPGKWQRATQQAQKGPKKPLNPMPKKVT